MDVNAFTGYADLFFQSQHQLLKKDPQTRKDRTSYLAGVFESRHYDCWSDFLDINVRTYDGCIISTSKQPSVSSSPR